MTFEFLANCSVFLPSLGVHQVFVPNWFSAIKLQSVVFPDCLNCVKTGDGRIVMRQECQRKEYEFILGCLCLF